MKEKQMVQNKEDLKIDKGDFVFQHRNAKFQDSYKMDEKVLGSGNFCSVISIGGYGTVQRCVHKATGVARAVKLMKKNKIQKADWTRLKYEIDILKNLDHPNILRLYETFEDSNQIYLVTEICDGGELFDEIVEKK